MQRFVKPIIVLVAVLATVLLVFTMNSQKHDVTPTPTVSVSPVANPPTKEELLKLVNEERAKNGVAPLVEDERLDTSAQRKADDEVLYNYYDHISPHDGKHGYEYINDVHINCKTDGENIAHNVDLKTNAVLNNTSKDTVNAWIQSPAHHAVMIDSTNTLTGFGINGTQIVEHFCAQ